MSMSDCEKAIARLIHVIAEHGEHVERARIELAKNAQFSPFTAFRRINKSTTGFLTEDDLDDFLREHGVNISEGGLKHFFSIEKDKTYGITYNSFLNHVLPLTDIELRNSCLEKSHKGIKDISEIDHRSVDKLLAQVYQREYEYIRAIDGMKTRVTASSNLLLEKAFQSLADDVTGYLSFKSLSSFMKRNNLNFGKKEYENFMGRVDTNLSGKVTPTDFKFIFFPEGISQNRRPEHGHNRAASSFNGISPIKDWSQSPNKQTGRKQFEGSAIERNERSFSPINQRLNNLSPDRKTHMSHIDPKFNSSTRNNALDQNKNRSSGYKPIIEGAPSTRSVLYNQEITAINEQLAQNVPGNNYYKSAKNPLEWRYLDPVYHNYWNYHRDHNRTLSPDYFNKAETHNQFGRHGLNTSKPGPNSVPFFNPTFVDPAACENLERYPDNPFRYTDHGHFFKNYYAGLRHNYYDKYYNYIPYQTRLQPTRSAVNSRNSPARSNNRSRDISPPVNRLQPEQPTKRERNLVVQTNPPNYMSNRSVIEEFMDKPKRSRDFSAEPTHKQSSPQKVDNAPYQYVFVDSQARPNQLQEDNDLRSSIKIEGQKMVASPKLRINPDQSRLTNTDLDNKPYTFVIVNK